MKKGAEIKWQKCRHWVWKYVCLVCRRSCGIQFGKTVADPGAGGGGGGVQEGMAPLCPSYGLPLAPLGLNFIPIFWPHFLQHIFLSSLTILLYFSANIFLSLSCLHNL